MYFYYCLGGITTYNTRRYKHTHSAVGDKHQNLRINSFALNLAGEDFKETELNVLNQKGNEWI